MVSMKKSSIVILFCFGILSLSISGCMQPQPLPESNTTTRTYNSSDFGISVHYPADWMITLYENPGNDPENSDYGGFQLTYTNKSTGFTFKMTGTKNTIPNPPGEDFTECHNGGRGADDRPNLRMIEGNTPVAIGGMVAQKSTWLIDDPEQKTVETIYQLCTSYKSGRIIYYSIFWSAPSEEFFTMRPVVQEILDSFSLYPPS